MRIEFQTEENTYEALNLGSGSGHFLNSWAWGEFQRASGVEPIRAAIRGIGRERAFTLYKKPLPLGRSYLYAPELDISGLSAEETEEVFRSLLDRTGREGGIFLRFEPKPTIPESLAEACVRTIDVQPARTLVIDLSAGEEALLSAMHQKTRYNIRLAERRGVAVHSAASDPGSVWELLVETARRDGFRLHGRDHYLRMAELPFMRIFLAEYEGRTVAAILIAFYGDTATYVHGASSDRDRSVMAPYALQWAAIREARSRGCRYYDLYGIDAKKWPGVTRFKSGFGGSERDGPGTYDRPLSPAEYNIYRAFRLARRVFARSGH